jgi:dethiobiotin synthetase
MKGIFVTGADTNIGKTFIACIIAKVLKEHGIDVGVMKPFATSRRRYSSTYASEDTWRLSSAAQVFDPDDLINPYFYQIRTAPLLAAIMSDRPIPDLDIAVKKLRILSRKHEFLVVEGIGGVMVPISMNETTLDFAKMIGFPVIIVTSAKLGTINHTLLTFDACRRSGVQVYAIIINKYPEKPSKAQERILPLLSALTGIRKGIEIPRIRNSRALKKVEKLIASELLNF